MAARATRATRLSVSGASSRPNGVWAHPTIHMGRRIIVLLFLATRTSADQLAEDARDLMHRSLSDVYRAPNWIPIAAIHSPGSPKSRERLGSRLRSAPSLVGPVNKGCCLQS